MLGGNNLNLQQEEMTLFRINTSRYNLNLQEDEKYLFRITTSRQIYVVPVKKTILSR